MKLIYSHSNLDRKTEFQILTRFVEDEDGGLTVEKEAFFPEAVRHLRSIRSNAELCSQQLKGFSVPIPSVMSSKVLSYSYLDYPTAERRIEQLLINKEFRKTDRLIRRLMTSLMDEDMVLCNIYQKGPFFLDPKVAFNTDRKEKCLKCQLIDFNFDNILVHPRMGTPSIIDTEWLSPSALPLSFILFRTLFGLTTNLQPLLRNCVGPRFPLIELFPYFYVPVSWIEIFKLESTDLFRFLSYECAFQSQVIGQVISPTSPMAISGPIVTSIDVATSVDRIKNNQSAFLSQQQMKIERLKEDLRIIQATKTYRLLQLVTSLKKGFRRIRRAI